MNTKKKKNMKQIFSVTEVCQSLDISRARYYQLMQRDIFPPPVFDIFTKRPYYTADIKEQCDNIKQTGIAFNGRYILFYDCQKKNTKSNNKKRNKNSNNSEYDELIALLNQMGIECNVQKVSEAVQELFPDGIENENIGLVAREVFRYVKNV